MEPFFIFITAAVVIVIAVMIRLMVGSFDGDRVESYVRQNGGELVDKKWDPFGPGWWFGDKHARIYRIMYRDRQGNLHEAHVKTSMLSGVYLTNDSIVENAGVVESSGHESL